MSPPNTTAMADTQKARVTHLPFGLGYGFAATQMADHRSRTSTYTSGSDGWSPRGTAFTKVVRLSVVRNVPCDGGRNSTVYTDVHGTNVVAQGSRLVMPTSSTVTPHRRHRTTSRPTKKIVAGTVHPPITGPCDPSPSDSPMPNSRARPPTRPAVATFPSQYR